MQIVTGSEMQLIEKQAMETLKIPPLLLMENAGSRVVDILVAEYGPLRNKRIHILAGPGNNGGDGFVVARQLLVKGARPKVYLVGKPGKPSLEYQTNLELLRKLGIDLVPIRFDQITKIRFSLNLADLVIDGIFGTGFKGGLEQQLSSLADLINDSDRPVVAIDIPSGVDPSTGWVETTAIKAQLTINLGLPKLGCFLYPGKAYGGKIVLADLGFPLPEANVQPRHLLGSATLQNLPPRPPWGHKGTFGHVLIVGGASKYGGAPYLSGQAALRGGSGVVTVAAPGSATRRFPTDELIVISLAETEFGTIGEAALPQLNGLLVDKDALVIGPGLGQGNEVEQVVQEILTKWDGPAVIDADGLRVLTDKFLASVPFEKRKNWIITPHPGEMGRLLGQKADYVDRNRVQVCAAFAKKWGMVVVLKGAPTIVSDGQKIYLNTSGNHGLATAGTGDVLAGLIGSLLAQGLAPLAAASTGVYVHGAAGDKAAREGARGLVARDCLNNLRHILQEEV